MEAVAYVVCALGAYLLGSVPTGFLVAKAKGVDIRTVGSKNMGATNVFRTLGKGPGILVLFIDALKGWLAVKTLAPLIMQQILGADSPTVTGEATAVVAGFCAILGHNYTCWLQFKGGKGIATSAGVLLALIPLTLAAGFVTWCVFFAITRYVSVGSLAASVAVPVATYIFYPSLTLRIVALLMGVLAVYKHKGNIQRLLNGTENRIGAKKPEPPKEAAS